MPYLTPDTAPGTTKCRVLIIPDDKEWLALVTGALSELTHAYNFEQFGTATPEQTAQAFRDMLALYVDCEPTVSDLIIIQDQKTGSHGGTFNSGADRTRTLNTEVIDTGNHATLSANQITLQAGTYRASCWAMAWYVGGHRLKLVNVTDSIEYIGSTEYLPQTNLHNGRAIVNCQFTIASAKVFELRHRCNLTAEVAGMGYSSSLNPDIYAEVKLERLSS